MDKLSWRLFIASALNNWPYVSVYALLDLLVIGSSTAFSALIALHFGFDVFGVHNFLVKWGITLSPLTIISSATLIAVIAFVARVFHGILDAKVIAGREIWFAREVRALGPKLGLSMKDTGRASNYYGRLSGASMKAFSTVIVVTISLLIIPITLPLLPALALYATLSICGLLLAFSSRFISTRMRNSSVELVARGRDIAIWKSNPDMSDSDSIEAFRSAYFQRIFLASIFGYAPLLFAILFSMALIVIDVVGIPLEFGTAFVAFVLAQMYLGLFGRMFSSFISAAAFVDAIHNFGPVLFNSVSDSAAQNPAR